MQKATLLHMTWDGMTLVVILKTFRGKEIYKKERQFSYDEYMTTIGQR